uniref:MFS domain-containing protein n=1 Tax=Rhabditophanes sp. KR3021 TaxID=114890 RepID=A0AC35TLV8_9BILA
MESNKWTGAFELYKQFKLNDWILFGLLSVTNIAVPTTFSCMAPFFNDVATNKGLTLSEVGIVFGVFNLGSTCGAIFFGKFVCLKLVVFITCF